MAAEALYLVSCIMPYLVQETSGLPVLRHLLVPIARKSGGIVLVIMGEGVDTGASLAHISLQLANKTEGAKTFVLVYSPTYPRGVATLSSSKLNIDSSPDAYARFAVYLYDFINVSNALHIPAKL